ncbi:hypothetical protein SNOG_07435 [Parastagonospora nodorum SN15]|uniref:Uncharacterized protein n=1 Tax=Phaeosphaeria nodorum (strain SN15 / ATCC MYA-4574 / FGSC 10173) TaxID=321614 RepID=Q0ULC9_PHANO|nr:hypothetical protein SNOG_07435 [Parastagonospora nodorum SN15]EAT84901.1 hypothetical protein SNOG_07435 [Parastagonospora nodorum SN15]
MSAVVHVNILRGLFSIFFNYPTVMILDEPRGPGIMRRERHRPYVASSLSVWFLDW